jgi:hypothetical protein
MRIFDSNPVADVLGEEDGQLLSRHVKFDSSSQNQGNEELHQWNFQGLLISFSPSLWEVGTTFCSNQSHSHLISDHCTIGKCSRRMQILQSLWWFNYLRLWYLLLLI